jgi:hypothetical protein
MAFAALIATAKAAPPYVEQLGRLDLTFSCPLPAKGIVEVSVWGSQIGGGGTFSGSFTGRSAVIGQHTFHFTVPAGAYHYGVNEGPRGVPICSLNYYAVALPGFAWQDRVTLHSGVGDPLTPMFVAGFKPTNITVSLYRDEGSSSACGVRLDVRQLRATQTVVRDAGKAYYASSFDYDSGPSTIPHVVKMTWPSGDVRFLLVNLREPEETISGGPTYQRLDLGAQLLERLLKMPPDQLNCL